MSQNSQTAKLTQDQVHERFLKMLPAIKRYVRRSFGKFQPELQSELVQEAVVNAYLSFSRLAERGKADEGSPWALGKFAVLHVRCGRRCGCPANADDITSIYCQIRTGVRIEPLCSYDPEEEVWKEILIEDRRATPADTAANRIDFAAWLSTLSRRNRQIAELLATGECTGKIARRFRLAAGRISQLRREFAESWQRFHGLGQDGTELELGVA